MNDLYNVLGVPKDAEPSLIRSTYKSKARTMHPDKVGGSTEAFQELNQAYSILRDPVKRAKYDKGESVEPVPPIETEAKLRLADMFSQAIEASQDDKDMIEVIRASIATGALNFQSTIDKMNDAIAKYEHVLERVKYTGGDDGDLFAGTVNQKIVNCQKTIESITKELELVKIVTAMLNDYECSVEPAKHASYLPGGMNSTYSGSYYP